MQQIPQIDFSNLNFLASMPSSVDYNRVSLIYTYSGPSQIAKQIAMGVVAQSAILPIAAPFPNSSWALDFNGPSLKCNVISDSESLNFQQNIAQFIRESQDHCNSPATYLAWFPRFDLGQNQTFTEPYTQVQGNTSETMFSDPESIFHLSFEDEMTEIKQDAVMYLAVMPNMLGMTQFDLSSTPKACDLNDDELSQVTANNPLGIVGGNVTMLQC